MNRVFAMAVVGFGGSLAFASVLAGCPIYSDNGPVVTETPSGGCATTGCATGSTCGADGRCVSADCTVAGCPSGLQCVVSNGSATCRGTTSRDGGADADADSAAPYSGCVAARCATDIAGGKCINNVCKGADDQCNDSTQCRTAQVCADGLCSATCSATKACPAGFGCNLQTGVCSDSPAPCGTGAACTGGAVCVSERCVAACGPNNTCAAGLKCIAGGCSVDQAATFSCNADGEVGTGEPGKCATGSVCVRKSCYIGCDPANAEACKNADKFNQCKSVATKSGNVNVCGSSTNLGSECDPSDILKSCVGNRACIDGFCR